MRRSAAGCKRQKADSSTMARGDETIAVSPLRFSFPRESEEVAHNETKKRNNLARGVPEVRAGRASLPRAFPVQRLIAPPPYRSFSLSLSRHCLFPTVFVILSLSLSLFPGRHFPLIFPFTEREPREAARDKSSVRNEDLRRRRSAMDEIDLTRAIFPRDSRSSNDENESVGLAGAVPDRGGIQMAG